MSIEQELVLHKKSFQELTVDELYELLRVRSEVLVSDSHPTPSCSTAYHILE